MAVHDPATTSDLRALCILHSRPFKYMCMCGVMICGNCVKPGAEHANHQFDPVESADVQRNQLKDSLSLLGSARAKAQMAEKRVQSVKVEIEDEGTESEAKARIVKHFSELRDALNEREQQLLADVTKQKTDKLKRLEQQQSYIQQYQNNIEHAQEQCQDALQVTPRRMWAADR